eukprot:CAMPEP_0197060744 /NCGR_PEP_ID=MMETSP1384-20130603/129982_1 /TAXON_ID=29189 /ORGANISM="Ammonia sp." /LENGTH=93 /DNA_ID=CAMNT_0042496151 /DNA_START=62 /DNA_END=339 /DNA_ORIENTATION=-
MALVIWRMYARMARNNASEVHVEASVQREGDVAMAAPHREDGDRAMEGHANTSDRDMLVVAAVNATHGGNDQEVVAAIDDTHGANDEEVVMSV